MPFQRQPESDEVAPGCLQSQTQQGNRGLQSPAPVQHQLITEIAVEVVLETEGRDSPAESEIVNIQERLRLILAGVGGASRIVIERLGVGVVGLEAQATGGAFDERDVQGIVAAGSLEQLFTQLVHEWIGVTRYEFRQRPGTQSQW